MTKNHILTKSVALGVVFMLSSFANATDRVLVEYFNKIYKTSPPPCFVDDNNKTLWMQEVEPKCLVRTSVEGGQYISGLKPGCTESDVKSMFASKINSICTNAAVQNDKAAIAKQQAAQQQAQAGGGGSSSVTSSKDKSTLSQAKDMYHTYKDVKKDYDKVQKAVENKDKYIAEVKDGWQKTKDFFSGKKEDKSAVDTTTASSTDPKPAQAATNSEGQIFGNNLADGRKLTSNNTPAGTNVDNAPAVPPQIEETVKATGTDLSADKKSQLTQLGTDQANAQRDAQAIAPTLPSETRNAGQEIVTATPETVAGAANTATTAKTTADTAKAATFFSKMQTTLGSTEACAPSVPQVTKILAAIKARELPKGICSKTAAAAGFLCPMTTSPMALKVQSIMSIGASVLSKATAASENCDTTSKLAKVAQAGILLGQVSCATSKFSCDLSCAKTEAQGDAILTQMGAALQTMQFAAAGGDGALPPLMAACAEAATAMTTAIGEMNGDRIPITVNILACEKHTADLALMGTTALGLLSAAQDGKKCKEQLSAGNNGTGVSTASGLAGPQMTTAEYCAQPQNAATITCKCTANPSAEGCMGSLAGSGVALGKVNSGSGASGFASAKTNGLGEINSLAKTSTDKKGEAASGSLSEAAREALGIADSGGPGGGGSSSNSGGFASEAEVAKAKEEKEKSKFGFFSSIGNMLSGGKNSGQAAKAAARGFEQDQAIKRKLASDQMRAEITTASGKSNFDKIKSRYQSNVSSFEQ